MSRILTVYYSRKGENYFPDGIRSVDKGNTAYAAEHIAHAVGADLFEIDTVTPYSSVYKECAMQAVQEARSNARPEIKEFVADLSDYDTIFVCYPCWCGTAPMCIFTFLEHYDMTGKKIVPLCTHEGSGMANSVADIQKACPGATVAEGLPFLGHQCKDGKDAIGAWARENV